ncbi:MAG: hypothetical protein R2932_18020 [Caldilineaceae bacterium]
MAVPTAVQDELPVAQSTAEVWSAMPTETEIYLLPDGRVVIADLPIELADLVQALGMVDPVAMLPPCTAATTP